MIQLYSIVARRHRLDRHTNASTGILRIGLACLVLCICGCSGETEYGKVDGVVTLDGKPVMDVEVVFLPEPDAVGKSPRSASYTDKNGRYSLRTDKGIEGAVVGTHRVLINDTAFLPTPPLPPGINAKSIPPKPQRRPVPDAYGNVQATPIKPVEVKAGTQTHNFDLSSR
jgi:hypothetical protein